MKPVLEALRAVGARLVAYLDDFLILGRTKEEAEAAFQRTKNMLQSLGFVINLENELSQATQRIEFLEFVINSNQIMFKLPWARVRQIKVNCIKILKTR